MSQCLYDVFRVPPVWYLPPCMLKTLWCLSSGMMSAQLLDVWFPVCCLLNSVMSAYLWCLRTCMMSAQLYDVRLPLWYLLTVIGLATFTTSAYLCYVCLSFLCLRTSMMSAYLHDVCWIMWPLSTCVTSAYLYVWWFYVLLLFDVRLCTYNVWPPEYVCLHVWYLESLTTSCSHYFNIFFAPTLFSYVF
jgi:hypothetical protein